MRTTLENSYCRPTTEAEWDLLGYNSIPNFGVKGERFYHYPNDGMVEMDLLSELYKYNWLTTEIPVQHFIDLVEDRICAWRLEEMGFVNKHDSDYVYAIDARTDLYITPNYNFIRGRYNSDEVDIPVNIKTFTDLLTLIRFLK